jgi:hypothetical protein
MFDESCQRNAKELQKFDFMSTGNSDAASRIRLFTGVRFVLTPAEMFASVHHL